MDYNPYLACIFSTTTKRVKFTSREQLEKELWDTLLFLSTKARESHVNLSQTQNINLTTLQKLFPTS